MRPGAVSIGWSFGGSHRAAGRPIRVTNPGDQESKATDYDEKI